MHDKNGTPLRTGDVVLVRARVRDLGPGTYCNVGLDVGFEKAHGPDNVHNSLTVNTRQVVLLERPAAE